MCAVGGATAGAMNGTSGMIEENEAGQEPVEETAPGGEPSDGDGGADQSEGSDKSDLSDESDGSGLAAQAAPSDAEPDFESRIAEYRFHLEQFDGPLDLLLHLIKEKKMDIFSVSIAPITAEFLEYVKAAQDLNLASVGEFLVVAASLIRIKSRSLLPREEAPLEDEDEEDDGAMLLRRLEDYQRFKSIAEILRNHEARRQAAFLREQRADEQEEEAVEFFEVDVYDLYSAFRKIMEEIESRAPREIVPEEFTVDEKMMEVQLLLKDQVRFSLPVYLMSCRSRLEVIVIFLAMLELIRQGKVRARQEQRSEQPTGEIWICRPGHDPESD